jgi:hypothetical protein
MIRKQRVHEENIQIRGMVGDDNVWPIWSWRIQYLSGGIETKNTHTPAPEDE